MIRHTFGGWHPATKKLKHLANKDARRAQYATTPIPPLNGDYGQMLGADGFIQSKWYVAPPRVKNRAAYSYAHKFAKLRDGRVRMA